MRLLSLDVLRGLALAGMILVNNPGDWGHIYWPFEHAPFVGLTLADLVFPTFMFVMGYSIPLSMRKYGFQSSPALIGKVIRRTVVILLVGFLLQWFSSGFTTDFSHFRALGVLHRLALCYGVTALFMLWLKPQRFLPVIALLLVAYPVLLHCGQGYEWSDQNIVARFDQWVLGPQHMYVDAGVCLDPEGVLSTLPAIAHVMIGCLLGYLLHRQPQARFLALVGVISLLVALVLHFTGLDPIAKKVWTTSFVLVTTGLAELMLALLTCLIDDRGIQGWWSEALRAFGVNPLPLYVVAWVLADWFGQWGITWGLYQWYAQCMPLRLASLLYALTFVLVCWLIAQLLYRYKVIIKA